VDSSYVDVWASQKLPDRFGFRRLCSDWERRHIDGRIYRYDNFPDTDWASVPTFPYPFHIGSQSCVIASPFSHSVEAGFRDFMSFVAGRVRGQDSK